MEEVLGYHVNRGKSVVGGTGVFVRCSKADSGEESFPCVRRGQIVGLYPGLLYLNNQPILLQSICNQFVFRCIDGVHIDGNDRRLSKMIYKSCVDRDRIDFLPIADTSWLTDFPLNPLSVGQYVNNQSKDFESNVAYQELTIPSCVFPAQALRFLPNLWFSPPRATPIQDVPLRLVCLVATKDIERDRELFSDYFTVVS
ncbi:UNVERIFIED_CONTAM: hypothetical protein GTU68_017494 [Idotea baltica]|nr:hypothetical protein [Idotea baltica]